jgi:hypothetical protein
LPWNEKASHCDCDEARRRDLDVAQKAAGATVSSQVRYDDRPSARSGETR